MKKYLLMFLLTLLSLSVIPVFTLFAHISFEKYPSSDTGESSQTILVYNEKTDKITEENLEEYLVGVVAAEMPALYEAEALKAQSVAARSYILSKLGTENPDHKGATVCTNPAHCKAYISLTEAKKNWGEKNFSQYLEKIQSAVLDTKGEYISYEGVAAVACFYAVGGGKTENAKDIWGGDTPYLRSVESPGDLSYNNLKSTSSFSYEEAKKILGTSSLEICSLSRTEGGSVKTICIGEKEFSGTEIRSLFGLNSANFEAFSDKNGLTFITTGKGHGVGMSQYGANKMAQNGKTYKEILLHYYSGVSIEKL